MPGASDTGFGVVMHEAPLEDIRSEARFGEKKGWVVEVGRLYSETEYFAEWDKRNEGGILGAGPPLNIRDLVGFAKPMVVFVHLFSRNRRAADLQHFWERLGTESSFWVCAVSLDTQVDADRGDPLTRGEHGVLDRADPQLTREGRALGRPLFYLVGGRAQPIEARAAPGAVGGAALRTRRLLQLRARRGGALQHALAGRLPALLGAGQGRRLGLARAPRRRRRELPFYLEAPRASGLPAGRARQGLLRPVPLRASLQEGHDLQGSHALDLPTVFEGVRCNHARGTHVVLQGVDATGRFLTSYAQEYPPALCEALAERYVHALSNAYPNGYEHNDVIPDKPIRKSAKKTPAPRLDAMWHSSRPWHELFRGIWSHAEHNNVLEARACVSAARHLAHALPRHGGRSTCCSPTPW